MEHPILAVNELTVRSRKGISLTGISFVVQAGEVISVFGPFGSGKSTLLGALAGQLPNQGMIRQFGDSGAKGNSRIEIASQPTGTGRGLTVQQWLSKRAASTRVPLAQRAGRLARALDALELFPLRDTPLKELSDGQQRSVSLAGGLAAGSPILLLDDLLDAMPEPLFERAWSHLRARASNENSAVIFSTVRSDVAERADRVLILDSGRLLAFAPPSEILSAYGCETVTIEAVDPSLVRGTLRGISEVEVEEIPGGVRFTATDGARAAADLFRHPPQGARIVYVRPPTLWDALNRLREEITRN